MGIEQVYLPEVPSASKILFKKEKKWTRPEMSPQLKKWVREWKIAQTSDPKAIHAQYDQIVAWEDQQWDRATNGCWFYNEWADDPSKEPEIVYLTGFHYWYLTEWQPYFGRPDFRDSDREIFYWIQFWEEDPDSYGGALNTIRRYAKSTIMSAWIVYRTTMNYRHNSGMQGETDKKIAKFYKKMVLKPFYKLPYYFQPEYNTDTKQTTSIEFDLPPQRSKKRTYTDWDEKETLESMIDYRSSGEGEYDGDELNSYIMEEPGKTKKVEIYNDEGEGRWDIVKPCFLQGDEICGKALIGTTVDYLSVADKGGHQYKKLFYDSNYNQKEEDGRTKSGLYSAFLPGDCAMKGYFDTQGRPMKEKARSKIMLTRKSYKGNPRKLAGWIRKYPLTITEIFYVSPDRCEFNAQILQDRLEEIESRPEPFTSTVDFYWENNIPFTKVKWRHNPNGGWAQIASPSDIWKKEFEHLTNQVGTKSGLDKNGQEVKMYFPKNDGKYCSGLDPIQHGSTGSSTESRPVQLVKSKYDVLLDGPLDQDTLERRAEERYQYKSNRYLLQMDHRPTNPLVLAERILMICWYFGISVHVEKQMGALIIGYFHEHGCGDFILEKYKPDFEKPDRTPSDGTAASKGTIQEYTGNWAWYIDYFGHTIPFKELLSDSLIFDAAKTTIHDYTVAAGWTELAERMKPKNRVTPFRDLSDFMPTFDGYGNVLN